MALENDLPRLPGADALVNFRCRSFLFSHVGTARVADFGLELVKAMAAFVRLAVLMAAAVLLFLSIYVLRLRSGQSLLRSGASMREVFALGVATNNAASRMPAMIDGRLAGEIDKSRVELLVPS